MILKLVDNLWVYVNHVTDIEEAVLWEELSVALPKQRFVDASQLTTMWDGVYRKYNRAKRRFARPLLRTVAQIAKKHNFPIQFEDERPGWKYAPLPPDHVTPDFLKGITLDTYQLDGIKAAMRCETGIISVPTGGGKGELIAGLCLAIPCPTIVIADQTVVVSQLKKRIELRDVSNDVGLFYAGHLPNGQTITVGSIQSLTCTPRMPIQPRPTGDVVADAKAVKLYESQAKAFKTRCKNLKILKDMVSKAEMVIVDECDRAGSKQYGKFFRYMYKGRRRYGLSGTPFDPAKPVACMDIRERLGEIIYEVERKVVLDAKRTIPVELAMMVMDGDPKESSAYDIAKEEQVVQNAKLHNLILKIVQKYPNDGTLILVDRQALGTKLEELLTANGIKCKFIYGKTTPKTRDKVVGQFERRELTVLIGGKILDRGLDLKGGCENLIIATGGKLWSDFNQKVGRAVRHNKLGKGRIFDFFFRTNRYLYDHARERLKIFLGTGFPATIYAKGGKIDGADLVAKRFRFPKGLLG